MYDIPQTGFDKWLQEQLKNPEFKKEYEQAQKEIREYDRRENERRRTEAEGVLDKEQTPKPS
jgi:hypothetical protein